MVVGIEEGEFRDRARLVIDVRLVERSLDLAVQVGVAEHRLELVAVEAVEGFMKKVTLRITARRNCMQLTILMSLRIWNSLKNA